MKAQESILQRIAPYSAEVLDPFVFQRRLPMHQLLKAIFITLFILPLRMLTMFSILLFAWILGITTIKGLPPEERNNKKPLSGWRRNITKPFIVLLARLIFFVGGFHWIRTKGKRASAREAPILMLVPHTSFWDTLPVIALGCPCMVVKDTTQKAPFFGDLINYAQPVFVERGNADSRQKTVDDILHRVRSGDDWEQILIFPEGTVTNRKALLEFKLGAFHPGVPIQPVFIRYPNKTDTITWTWEGPGVVEQMWLTLSQLHVFCELEFLPVYQPSASERKDPKLYAENLRRNISTTCNIPVTYFSLDDIKYLRAAKTEKLPRTVALVKLLKLRNKTGLDKIDVKTEISNLERTLESTEDFECDVKRFAELIGTRDCEAVRSFFALMDQENTEKIDIRVYIVGLWLLIVNMVEWKRLEKSFKAFDPKGVITATQFAAIALLWRGLPMKVSCDVFYVFNIEFKKKGHISFETFKSVATSFMQLEKNLKNAEKKLYNNNNNNNNNTNNNNLSEKSRHNKLYNT